MMFRCEIGGREAIIRVDSRLCNSDINKDHLYNKVFSLGEQLLNYKDGDALILIDEDNSHIIIEIKYSELLIVTIQYIIEKTYLH